MLPPAAFAATLALAAAAPLAAPGGASATDFAPCAQTPGFSCAGVPVPLDRSGAVPGTLTLSVERKPSLQGVSKVAVLALAGGPGQATLPLAGVFAEALGPGLDTHDLLLFDQRGTGASDPLACAALRSPALAAANSFGEVIERCAQEIGPARGAFTTSESVEDIEAMRRAAGYEKLILYGISYGTKVALDYAARYPQNVAGLVLDSTETPNGPEPFHVSTFKAMGPALRELCAQRACARIAPAPVSELARLVARARSHPLAGVAYGEHGKRITQLITGEELYAMVLGGDLNPALRAELPAAVHAALAHDLAPLARMITLAGVHKGTEEQETGVDEALFIDTSCEETPFPWSRTAPQPTREAEAEAAVVKLPAADFYPFNAEAGLADQTIPLCVSWPDASAAPAPAGPEPDVPTLILSGGQDLRTPLENARAVAALIPGAQLLQVPYTGHSVIGSDLSGCARNAVSAFLRGERALPCAPGRNPFPPSPVPPTRLASLAPVRGVPGARGRTVTAAVDALGDVRRTVLELSLDLGAPPVGVPFGGLRGGTVELTDTAARLRGLSYVPGVKLTGTVPARILLEDAGPGATLEVSGSAAAHGRLRISAGGRLSGVLSGRAVHAELPLHAGAAASGLGALGGLAGRRAASALAGRRAASALAGAGAGTAAQRRAR